MGYTARWKILEQLMLDMRKKGVSLPPSLIKDLRNAKLMQKIWESSEAKGETSMEVDEYFGNVESILLTEAQKTLGFEYADGWLRRIDEANMECEACKSSSEKEKSDKFISGVPRDQKWVRVEPDKKLTPEKITEVAVNSNLAIVKQENGRLVVYGQQANIQVFLKKMTSEATKKP